MECFGFITFFYVAALGVGALASAATKDLTGSFFWAGLAGVIVGWTVRELAFKITSLHTMLWVGDLYAGQRLIMHGKDVKEHYWDGPTPLHIAVEENLPPSVICMLVEAGASMYAKDSDGYKPLHRAVLKANVPMIKLLVFLGCPVDVMDGDRRTSLHLASECQLPPAIAEVLVRAGASMYAKDNNGYPPLHSAVAGGNIDMIKTLMRLECPVDLEDTYGDTPLHTASSMNKPGAVRLLISWGAALNRPDHTGHTPLHVAIHHGNLDIANILISQGASVDSRDKKNKVETPLHLAVGMNNLEAVRLLTGWGAAVNVPDWKGDTPLHIATSWGCCDIVRILIGRGASVHRMNNIGIKPAQCIGRFSYIGKNKETVKIVAEIRGLLQPQKRKELKEEAFKADNAERAKIIKQTRCMNRVRKCRHDELNTVRGEQSTLDRHGPGVIIGDDAGAVVDFLSSEFDQYRLMHFNTFFLDFPDLRHGSADDAREVAKIAHDKEKIRKGRMM